MFLQHLLKYEDSSVPASKLTNGFNTSAADEEDSKVLEPKEELQYLSQVLGFKVTYTDFPQKSASKQVANATKAAPEYITLVKLSTKPPKVGEILALKDAIERPVKLCIGSQIKPVYREELPLVWQTRYCKSKFYWLMFSLLASQASYKNLLLLPPQKSCYCHQSNVG